jgi:hypothetical protein
MTRIGLMNLVVAGAAAEPPASSGSARLLDFSASIPDNGEPLPVWRAYLGDSPDADPDQTTSLTGGVFQDIVGTDSSPYIQFIPYPYNAATGYTKHANWLKAGETWQANTFNRFSFGFKCSNAISRNSNGSSQIQIGNYIRGPDHTGPAYQGAHFYHLLNPNIPAGRWVKCVMTPKPGHQVGRDAGNNWPPHFGVPYPGRPIQTASTSQSSWIQVLDDDGVTPITAYASLSTLAFTYNRDQDGAQAITVSELGSEGAAYSSGGMFHVGSGWWRIDVPNAAWNSGVDVVTIDGNANNFICTRIEHPVSGGATNTSPNLATEGVLPGTYFDYQTRWYFDFIQTPDGVGTWQFMDFRFYEEPNATTEVDHEISNYCITYTGTRYEVEFQGLKNISRTYEFRYRLDGQSMRANGFTSGTDGSTVTNTGDDYTGVLWASSNMAESTSGIYVAWRVQGETDFEETFFQYNYGPGNDGYAEQF